MTDLPQYIGADAYIRPADSNAPWIRIGEALSGLSVAFSDLGDTIEGTKESFEGLARTTSTLTFEYKVSKKTMRNTLRLFGIYRYDKPLIHKGRKWK